VSAPARALAARTGAAGIVVDGFCRDLVGLRGVGDRGVCSRDDAGLGLETHTNYHEHVRRLEQGQPTQLTYLA
jgi:hypothetical protein